MTIEAWSSTGGKFIMMKWNKDDMNKENKTGENATDTHVDKRFKIKGQ